MFRNLHRAFELIALLQDDLEQRSLFKNGLSLKLAFKSTPFWWSWRQKSRFHIIFSAHPQSLQPLGTSFPSDLLGTLWKLQNFSATIFPQKFHQINVLLKQFWRKKFAWQWNSRLFHTVLGQKPRRLFVGHTFSRNYFGPFSKPIASRDLVSK